MVVCIGRYVYGSFVVVVLDWSLLCSRGMVVFVDGLMSLLVITDERGAL